MSCQFPTRALSIVRLSLLLIAVLIANSSLGQTNHSARPEPFHRSSRGISQNGTSGAAGNTFFLPAVTYPTVGAYNLAIGDVNNDGIPDVVVANFTQGIGVSTVGILLGNGDGTLKPEVTYFSGGGYCVQALIADLNRDGKPDLVLFNLAGGDYVTDTVAVLLGNGDGTFQTATSYNVTRITGIAVGDINGDSFPDIVVSQDDGQGGGYVSTMLGNGDGSLQSPVGHNSGGGLTRNVVVADFDGDGHLDIGVIVPEGIAILLSNGDVSFQAPVFFPVGNPAGAITAVDVNNDRKLDLVMAQSSGNGSVVVLLGNGNGTFQSPVTYSSGGYWSSDATVADIDGDGKPDIIVSHCGNSVTSTCSSLAPGQVALLLGNGDGTFQAGSLYDSGGTSFNALAVSDLNGDGRPDVVTANFAYPATVGVLINNSQSNLNSTTTVLGSSTAKSVFGQPVKFTATVTSGSGTPSGTVSFSAGVNPLGSAVLVGGMASITTPYLGVGTDPITASYQGGAAFAPSLSKPVSVVVSRASTAVTLTSTPNPSSTLQPVTFTATVAGSFGGVATGTVTFHTGSQSLGSATLSGNVATLITTFSTAGTFNVAAHYAGDSNNLVSNSPTLSQKILTSTTTTVTSNPNPALIGQTVTFTAGVGSASGPPPNGEVVTFYDGSSAVGTGALSSGVAVFSTAGLSIGSHSITAKYSGDSKLYASTSTVLRQGIDSTAKSPTTTSLTSSLNPSTYGQKVTLTATVTNTGGTPPTGRVVFSWGTTTLGGVQLDASGVATLTRANLGASLYPIVATYKGDSKNLSSASPVVNQVVNPTTSKATLTSSANNPLLGVEVTFTAKITSPTVIPTGPVSFQVGNTVVGTVQLSGGKAEFTTSSLPLGVTVVTVTYAGNSNIQGSSASVTETVR